MRASFCSWTLLGFVVQLASSDARAQITPPECIEGYFEPAFDHQRSTHSTYKVDDDQWANADNDSGDGHVRAMHLCLIPSPLLPEGPLDQGAVLVWDGNEEENPDGTQFWSIMRPELPDGHQDKFWNFELLVPDTWDEEDLIWRPSDYGCAGHSWMSDGRMFLAAGTSLVFGFPAPPMPLPGYPPVDIKGARFAFVFDPKLSPSNHLPGTRVGSNLWTQLPDMRQERWYPSGSHVWENAQDQERMLVTGGRDKTVPRSQTKYDTYEAWDPTGTGAWAWWGNTPPPLTPDDNYIFAGPEDLNSQPSWHDLHLYPRHHLLSNGELFRSGMVPDGAVVIHVDGPGTSDASWLKKGSASQTAAPNRRYGASVLFPNIDANHTNAVVILGGFDPDSGQHYKSVDICKASAPGPGNFPQGYDWKLLNGMGYRRAFPNAVILPDASIVVFGGTYLDAQGNTIPVFQAERFKGGTWQPLASASSVRDYHSSAVLLPSGKVLLAGGDSRSTDYEIYVPWYLAGCFAKPSWVTYPPQELDYNAQYTAQYSLAVGAALDKVVLIRPGSTTHHSDFDQRYVELPWFEPVGGNQVTFTTPVGWPGKPGNPPGDSNAAPKGWYTLFLVSSEGVPSVAHWVKLR